MANLTGFTPLDGVPDAAVRGMGTFHFDDGQDVVHEDPELAQYALSLPPPQKLPDLRLASNDPGFSLSPEQLAMTGATPENTPLTPAAPPSLTSDQLNANLAAGQSAFAAPDNKVAFDASGLPVIGNPSAAPAPAPAPSRPAAPAAPMPGAGGVPVGGLPSEPTDADRAAELHRLAGDAALRGSYVAPRQAGYVPVQRQGALPKEMAERQAQERGAANDDLLRQTELARQQEAEDLRKTALHEAMRIEVQKADEERRQQEAEARRQRLLEERRALNDAEIDTTYASGNGLAQAMGVLGAALLGATGSDAGLRMIEQSIERNVRNQMQVRGSKLNALAEQLGSEEQAIAGAKAKIYGLLEKEAGVTGKLMQASGIENQTPAILAQLKQKAVENEQEHERLSLGKTVENYQAARAGGRTGPNLDAAAKHYEQAAKLTPAEQAKVLDGLTSAEEKDFIARVEGLADAEHSLNEIDQNIGIQRDGAGNVVNQKELGNIEGAGFFGGRTPDEWSSTKGAALSRERRRFVQAQVKAMSGAAATDVEREEYGKGMPLNDEKDLVNSTTEERRRWQKNYAKAVALYGPERVQAFLGQYRGQRKRINTQRGRPLATESATQVLQKDEEPQE